MTPVCWAAARDELRQFSRVRQQIIPPHGRYSSSRPTTPKACKFTRAGTGQPWICLVARLVSRSLRVSHCRQPTDPVFAKGKAGDAAAQAHPSLRFSVGQYVRAYDGHRGCGHGLLVRNAELSTRRVSARGPRSCLRVGVESAGDPFAVAVVEGSELVGDEAGGFVHLLGGRGGVLVHEQSP